jgi:hypothetical protein
MNPLTVNPVIAIAHARAEDRDEAAHRRPGRRDGAIHAARIAREAIARAES